MLSSACSFMTPTDTLQSQLYEAFHALRTEFDLSKTSYVCYIFHHLWICFHQTTEPYVEIGDFLDIFLRNNCKTMFSFRNHYFEVLDQSVPLYFKIADSACVCLLPKTGCSHLGPGLVSIEGDIENPIAVAL